MTLDNHYLSLFEKAVCVDAPRLREVDAFLEISVINMNDNVERKISIIEAKKIAEEPLDLKEYFKIYVDRKNGKIVAIHHFNGKPRIIIKGETSEAISSTITELGLVSTLNHAAYIGRKLLKAEISIKIDKTYIQDEPVFEEYQIE